MVNKLPAGLYFLAVLLISRQARTDMTASDGRDYAGALRVHRVEDEA